MVYYHALSPPVPGSIVIRVREESFDSNLPIAATLLRTCKTIHAEARGILYSQPIFVSEHVHPVVWLRGIGRENRFYLRIVQLHSIMCLRLPRKDSQAISRKVATLLADAQNLEYLEIRAVWIPRIDWNLHKDQNGQIQQRKCVIAAQYIAKVIYDVYRPLFSKGLSCGKTPQQLSTSVRAHWKLFFRRRILGTPYQYHMGPYEIVEAEAEVARHFKLLLERNLHYRRHPRFKQKPEVV
ncbi:hypothetical protein LX32DRAFT_665505 [Colletotrichum zoysiae]|uniref:Uncharacterized protein n=1 Tax=Colletotrichum zoysiae TaxID=1216348 RepID=A0AAD9LZ18_9PEZI|nr:hypothetical protein LX32DRAFT_665505 [Colletotrichum zoysiae]